MINQNPYEALFAIRCAEYMGIEWMELCLDHIDRRICYAPTRDSWDVPVPYDPYNNFEQLGPVVDKLFQEDAFDLADYDLELRDDGMKETAKRIAADCLISPDDAREIFEMKDRQMINNIIQGDTIRNIPESTPYEDLAESFSIPVGDDFYDTYTGASQDVADKVAGEHNRNNLRKFVENLRSDKNNTEQDVFNKFCMTFMDYHVGIDDRTYVDMVYDARGIIVCSFSIWDPWHTIGQVEPVVDMISKRTGFPKPYAPKTMCSLERIEVLRDYVLEFMDNPDNSLDDVQLDNAQEGLDDLTDMIGKEIMWMLEHSLNDPTWQDDVEDDWLNAPPVGKEWGSDEYDDEPAPDFLDERKRLGHIPYGGCRDWRAAEDIHLKFNREAARLTHLTQGSGYCLDLSTWNPWENVQQLQALVRSLSQCTGMEFYYPVEDNLEDAQKDYVMVCARSQKIDEILFKRARELYGDKDWYDHEKYIAWIESMRVENSYLYGDRLVSEKEWEEEMARQADEHDGKLEKATDNPLTLVAYISDMEELCETPATREHDDDYQAARLLVLGDYRGAEGKIYIDCHGKYIIPVKSHYWGYDHEVVEYETNIAQAVFLEEYIRNDSYYKNELWQQASRNVDKPDDDELNPESIYNWKLEILRECFRFLSIAADKSPSIENDFNDLCMDIAERYCISWADTQRDNWNPWENDEQLHWVFDTVVNYAGIPFVMLGDINGGLKQVWLEDSMRNYIFENGRSIIHG